MTKIRQYRMHLAAMMSLVIEEVRHCQLLRPADFVLRAADNPHEVLVKPVLLHSGSPSGNIGIGAHSFGTEFGEIRIELIALLYTLLRFWPAGEAEHPDTVTPQQVVQRAVE